MKKDNSDDININDQSSDKSIFESDFFQSLSEKLVFLKEESSDDPYFAAMIKDITKFQ